MVVQKALLTNLLLNSTKRYSSPKLTASSASDTHLEGNSRLARWGLTSNGYLG